MKTEEKYFRLTVEESLAKFATSRTSGLSIDEVKKRLEQYGLNEFEKKKPKSILSKFFAQFKSFMIIVLLVAAAISGVIGYIHGEGFIDAIIILAIVIINAVIGTIQEAKAEQSLAALEKMSAPHCKVVREGKVEVIESRELVPGDIVVLDTGDAVPADIRLIEAINLKIQESALTGESVPTEKDTNKIDKTDIPLGDRTNLAFSSCAVTYGRGMGVVIATGMHTEVGKIAAMIQSAEEVKTPLQQKLDKLGKVLGIAALTICLLLFGVGLLYGKDPMEMFMIAVSLAAAAIPEGLPAVSTIVLAVGVQRLVKKNAIVRTLPSVEALGSITVICSDKTGTLTQNKMTVVDIFTDMQSKSVEDSLAVKSPEQNLLLEIAILCNDTKLSEDQGSYKTTGDPTETSLVDAALKFGINKNTLDTIRARVAEIPFDSERKLMTTVHKLEDGKYQAYTKGGLDELLGICDTIIVNGQTRAITTEDIEAIRAANLKMAGQALRVLSMGYKTLESAPAKEDMERLESGMTFVGMVGMIDPPRPEAKVAVEKCIRAGIKPVMITGDHIITASAIAQQLGIKQEGDEVRAGLEIDKMSDEELRDNIHNISVYARVSPEHKVRIVKAFQHEKEIVAMTGDGVNDAPALKLADIGAAMGITGTDVSKEAADIVLTDDNFATVVTAVEEGRRIYDNILKAIQFMLSTNLGEITVLFVAVLANWGSPLLPIHILWINLVTDGLPALALSVDPADKDIMDRKPIDSKGGIMSKDLTIRVFLQGLMIGALALTAYMIGEQANHEVGQTMAFAVLAFTQLVHVFNVRSPRYSAFRTMFSNKYLWGAVIIVAGLMFAVLEIPALHSIFHVTILNATQWLWVAGLSLAPLPLVEITKLILRLFRK